MANTWNFLSFQINMLVSAPVVSDDLTGKRILQNWTLSLFLFHCQVIVYWASGFRKENHLGFEKTLWKISLNCLHSTEFLHLNLLGLVLYFFCLQRYLFLFQGLHKNTGEYWRNLVPDMMEKVALWSREVAAPLCSHFFSNIPAEFPAKYFEIIQIIFQSWPRISLA